MSAIFTAQRAAVEGAGRWIVPPSPGLRIKGFGIDTRGDLAGRAYVALRGDRFDGHDFLAAAIDAGAVMLVVERDVEPPPVRGATPGVPILRVSSSVAALTALARAWRSELTATRVIAITGSAGKTTTKRLIHGILSTRFAGSASPKSFNNHIGVPLTILDADRSDEYLVLEIGMNAPGEIAALAAVARPDIAVITMVGRAHLEGLGSLEAIAAEKASLLRFVEEGGVVIANADQPALAAHLAALREVRTFGESAGAGLRLRRRGLEGNMQALDTSDGMTFRLRLPGRHNAVNALAAILVAREMGMTDASIAEAIEAIEPADRRMEPVMVELPEGGAATIFNDAYNANPDSMAAALATFAELAAAAARRVVILGDMRELGTTAPQLHRELGARVADLHALAPLALVIFIGELSAHAASAARSRLGEQYVRHYPALDEPTSRAILASLQPGDAVLLKASRGMQLERLLLAATPCAAEPRE